MKDMKALAAHAAKPASKAHAGLKAGGKTGYASGGAMPMKDGKPAFIGDGKGMMAKGGTVTKKQLEESGFDNLRDYMNADRGLMRKDGKVALRKGDMDIKSAAEKRSATRMADVTAKKPQADRRSDTRLKAGKASSASSRAANMMTDGDEASSLSSAVMSGEARKRRAGKDNATNAALADRYNSIDDSASGYKKGGSVAPSKMGKVKTGSGRDGIAERGYTKAGKSAMKMMARGGKTC